MEEPSVDSYDMNHPCRGTAVIVTNTTFFKGTDHQRREGGERDEETLQKLFTDLNFKTQVHRDLTKQGILAVLDAATKLDHSDSDMFVFAISSHGGNGIVFGTDESIKQEDMMEMMTEKKCTTLANKPKMFIIQACRGDKFDEVVIATDCPEKNTEKNVRRGLVHEPHFLVYYASPPGCYAFRNTDKGSYMIQFLNEVLSSSDTHRTDILQLLTRFNYRIAHEFESKGNYSGYKQVPSIVSSLTKQLVLSQKTLPGEIKQASTPTASSSKGEGL